MELWNRTFLTLAEDSNITYNVKTIVQYFELIYFDQIKVFSVILA